MSENNHETNRNLLVIKASAGSGKTYNLALQYIKHLLFTTDDNGKLVPRRQHGDTCTLNSHTLNSHRQILAITFTNKATDEMKQRIVDKLYDLAEDGRESEYLATFMQDTGLDENEIRNLARHALNELLFDYSNFNVSTIDSFFQTILRNFARELDRDFNYDIQLQEDYAVRVAVHNFLLSLGKDGGKNQVDNWVRDYQRHLLRDGSTEKKWKFFNDSGELTKFAKQINTELFRSQMQKIRDYLGHTDEDGHFKSDFSKIRAFQKSIHDAKVKCEEAFDNGPAELTQVLQPYYSGLKRNSALYYLSIKTKEKKLSDKLQNATNEDIAKSFNKNTNPDDEFIGKVLKKVQEIYANNARKDFYEQTENDLGLLGMLAMIDLFLEEYRHETNSILIGDTNELIGTVLESGVDFIYERVGTRIKHFMIDEFQDTSTKQYKNFKGLLEESLAYQNFNMLIGDGKQSIYRFRNADPSVFREKINKDFGLNIYQPAHQEGQPGSTNFRSSEFIIRFNNTLFTFVRDFYPDCPEVNSTYEDVEQALPPNIGNKVPGYVRIYTGNYDRLLKEHIIDDFIAPNAQEGVNIATANNGQEDVDESDVLRVLPGYLLKLHERYDWKRIGILVNTHKNGNDVVECILNYNKHTQGEKINIISGESLLLNNSPIIRRIIAMLRFIDISQFSQDEDNEDDMDNEGEAMSANDIQQRILKKRQSDQRMYAALSAFIKKIAAVPDDQLTAIDNGKLLEESFNNVNLEANNTDSSPEAEQESMALSLEQLLPSNSELSTLVSIVETIIAHFKSDENDNADVDRETAFLLAFQDCVLQFSSQRNGGSVREFLKYWEENKDKLAVSSADTGDAINIMTIHAAKGLEFDCVVIPYADWELSESSQEKTYWMTKKIFIQALSTMDNNTKLDDDNVPPLLRVNKKTLRTINSMGLLNGDAAKFLNKQLTDLLIDNLNKTYVAFTRPRSELHIFSKGGSDTSVTKLLNTFVSSKDSNMTPILDADGKETGWFEYGTLSTREEIESKRSNDEEKTSEQLPVNSYQVTTIPLQLQVRVEHASSKRIKAGKRLHALLSRIHDRNDVDRVIASGIKHGTISDDPRDRCNRDIVNTRVRARIMDPDDQVSQWFDPANKVYNERTITFANRSSEGGSDIANLRPDRIVRRPNGQLLVIDFKTGQRNDEEYIPKMRLYINQMRASGMGDNITGYIWYTTLGDIDEVH